jgi:hypothetical protein
MHRSELTVDLGAIRRNARQRRTLGRRHTGFLIGRIVDRSELERAVDTVELIEP